MYNHSQPTAGDIARDASTSSNPLMRAACLSVSEEEIACVADGWEPFNAQNAGDDFDDDRDYWQHVATEIARRMNRADLSGLRHALVVALQNPSAEADELLEQLVPAIALAEAR